MAQTPEEVAARQAIEAQHLARDDRLLASQRAAVDSAKLVSTFVLALASTLVGTALQISPRASGELIALIFTGISLLCVLAVILLDSLDIPTFDGVAARDDGERQRAMQTVVDLTIKSATVPPRGDRCITSSGWLRPADRPIFDASACEREEVGLRADPLTLRSEVADYLRGKMARATDDPIEEWIRCRCRTRNKPPLSELITAPRPTDPVPPAGSSECRCSPPP